MFKQKSIVCEIVKFASSPSLPLGQSTPEWIGLDHPLDELAPEHTVRDDTVPLLADEFSSA